MKVKVDVNELKVNLKRFQTHFEQSTDFKVNLTNTHYYTLKLDIEADDWDDSYTLFDMITDLHDSVGLDVYGVTFS